MATSLIQSDTYAIKQEIARLQEELTAAQPVEPEKVGSVIRFPKYNQKYSFAAIKATEGNESFPAQWFITQDGSRSSRQGHPNKSWDELLRWIGERNWVAIEVLG